MPVTSFLDPPVAVAVAVAYSILHTLSGRLHAADDDKCYFDVTTNNGKACQVSPSQALLNCSYVIRRCVKSYVATTCTPNVDRQFTNWLVSDTFLL